MDNAHLNAFGDFLEQNNISFGVEFETVKGWIPERLCYKYGLIPLRDGSIAGIEYVTVPLRGRKGLYALRDICNEMSKRTQFNQRCALHLHLGGLSRDERSILSAFILAVLTQDESIAAQPGCKREGHSTGDKDYCKKFNSSKILGKLPKKVNSENLKKWFTRIFNFISDGKEYEHYKSKLELVGSHPSDPSGNRKWQIRSRYYYINFVPIIFGNRITIEFRQHNITNDFFKIVNFLFSTSVFIWTAENCSADLFDDTSSLFQDLIKKPMNANSTLVTNMMKNIPANRRLLEVGEYNKQYMTKRVEIMQALTNAGDITAASENKFDKEYSKLGKIWE